jgi:hypothetical protein
LKGIFNVHFHIVKVQTGSKAKVKKMSKKKVQKVLQKPEKLKKKTFNKGNFQNLPNFQPQKRTSAAVNVNSAVNFLQFSSRLPSCPQQPKHASLHSVLHMYVHF